MNRSLLLTCCLLLAACGVPEAIQSLPDVATLDPYDTASGVLGRLGQPCRTRPMPDGTEAWDYCGRKCPPPGISQGCARPCADDCQRGWTFYLLSGVVVRYELWGE